VLSNIEIPKFGQCITFSKADEEELVIYLVKLDSIRYGLTYRDVVCQTNCEKGETVSVMACMSASGQYIPPFVVMKGQRYNDNSLSKGCHLDVVRGPSTPHDPESDAGGSVSSWQGHPSW
jgi:hypothetical protein